MDWYDGLTVAQDPDDTLDWAWDYADWLATGDSLSTHTATAATGFAVDSSSIAGDQVVVWLSGGTAGLSYDVTVHAVTSAGRELDRTVTFEVGQK